MLTLLAYLLLAISNLIGSLVPPLKKKKEDMVRIPYSFVVESLIYAMVIARLDITHVVGLVSKLLSNPNRDHWKLGNGCSDI